MFPLRLCVLITGVPGAGELDVLPISPLRSSWIEFSRESIREDICDTASCTPINKAEKTKQCIHGIELTSVKDLGR